MTDIERLKKINNMVVELKKHGIAPTYDEAALQSEGIFRESIPVFRDTAPLLHPQDVKMTSITEEAFETYKKAMDSRVATAENRLDTVISKMNEIIATINKLEEAQKAVPREPQRRLEEPKPQPKQTEAQIPAGELTPGDVDINKVFYFGNK